MRLTVDSNDPLSEVLAVVGSMYGVRLQVAPDVPVGEAPPALHDVADTPVEEQPGPAPRAVRATGRPRRAAAAASTAPSPRASARARRAAPPERVNSAVVRAWARENGHEVSDRGRLAAGLIAAYREATG